MASDVESKEGSFRLQKNDLRIEPSLRWIRVKFNEQIIAGSKSTLLVKDGYRLAYYFPESDVDKRWLIPNQNDQSDLHYFDVVVGDRSARAAAWSFPESEAGAKQLAGRVAFNWRKMDHWYEEEEEVFVHPRDPYHRVDSLRSTRHIRVEIDGLIVAESTRPVLLFETGLPTRYYLPQEDIRMDLLQPTRTKTQCPYKGEASYWSAVIGENTYRNITWSYLEPIKESYKIAGLLSFFNEKVDIYVDGELEVRPQTPWS